MIYALSLICGIAYAVSIVLGDAWPGLGIACFVLMVVAIVSDRRIGTSDHAARS